MQKKHNPILPYDSPDGQPYEELYGVASSTECTGLIPSAPLDPAEVSSYQAIYDVPMSKNAKAADHGLQTEHRAHK